MKRSLEKDYLEIVYPRLVGCDFHLIPSKWEKVSEQSKLAHILNGVFVTIRIFKLLERWGQFFDEEFERKVICAITIHDILKGIKKDHTDVVLEETKRWTNELSLKKFCRNLDDKDLRAVIAAHMKWSSHKGAILTSSIDPRILVFVNLADYLSSMEAPDRLFAAQRILKEINPNLEFIYHKTADIRGYITGFIHITIAEILEEKYNVIPVLFFPNGTLYLGENQKIHILRQHLKKVAFSQHILKNFHKKIETQISKEGEGLLSQWINPTSVSNIVIPTAFMFFPLEKIIDRTKNKTIDLYGRRMKNWGGGTTPQQYSEKLSKKTKQEIKVAFTEEDILLAPYLRIITYILKSVKGISPLDATFLLSHKFGIKLPEKEKMRKYSKNLTSSAAFDDCRILAKYYLDLVDKRRVNFSRVLDDLDIKCKSILKYYSGNKYLNRLIPSGLKTMWDEIDSYLYEILVIDGKSLILPEKKKLLPFPSISKTSGKMCPICNKVSTGTKQFISLTKISSQVFTNWMPPWRKRATRKICGVCYVEFMLRNIFFDMKQLRDERCYLLLFVFPQYSFVPALWEILDNNIKRILESPSMKFDSYQAASSVLKEDSFNPLKCEDFGSILSIKGLMTVLRPEYYTPGFFFLVWNVPKAPVHATEIEKWALASYFSLLLQQALNVKVLVTQNVYPTIQHSGEMPNIIKLIGAHHFIKEIFGEDISLKHIKKLTDLASAIWYAHTWVNKTGEGFPDEARVGYIFRIMSSVIFPGSTLAKRYLRLNKKNVFSSISERDQLIKRSAQIINAWRK